jgi:8-oxo-dGTP pyrophosphatase MutT (NUDIX family)
VSFDPLTKPDRVGEVAMVIRRPSGKILLSTKEFYPPGAYRIPTGGISHGESILDALLRETREETGLAVEVLRFLAAIDYLPPAGEDVAFRTFAFLLDERGGNLGPLDPSERISSYREIAPDDLPKVAERLEASSGAASEIGGDWADWGRFRAVVHHAVADALANIG